MSIIDTSVTPQPANSKTMFQRALIAGGYSAGIGIIVGLIFYVTGLDIKMLDNAALNWANRLLLMGVAFYFIYTAVQAHRDHDRGGYISVGQAVGLGTLAGVISGLITAVWVYLFMTFIAPDMMDAIKEVTMRQMEEQGQSDEQIEQAMKMAAPFFSSGAIAFFATFFSVIIGTISGLISGFALKKENVYR